MELRMIPYTLPDTVGFNYEELKTALTEKVAVYEATVYTEDQVREAKADKAKLNKLRKALNDERIRQERAYMEPFAAFKSRVNEIIGIIDRASATVDAQVKAFDEQRRAEKRGEIEGCWSEILAADRVPEGVTLAKIFDEKWLNASVSMKSIQETIAGRLDQIAKDLDVIDALPAYAFEAKQAYISSLDLAKAVSEAHRLAELAERKAAHEAEQVRRREAAEAARQQAQTAPAQEARPEPAELPTEPVREWIGFQAFLSRDEAAALGAWFKSNGIRYKAI